MKQRDLQIVLTCAIVFLAFTIFAVNPITAYAHAPKELKIAYDEASQKLTVTITHKSPFPNSHYIEKVEIKKNGSVVSTNPYKNQPDRETFDYIYQIPAAEGDILEVKAVCSFFGSKTEQLKVVKSPK